MPSENNSCYQQGQAPSSLAAPSLPICRKHQPSPPWALTGLPCALGKQKGTPGPQRLGSREIKEPSIFGEEKEKGRDCSQQGHHPQGCENSLCQANSMTLAFVGKWGFTPGKEEAPTLPPSSPLSKHRDRRLQSISREAGIALDPSAHLCCQRKNKLISNCRFGGKSPRTAAGLCGMLHTVPVTQPGPWHTLNTQGSSRALMGTKMMPVQVTDSPSLLVVT